MLLSLALSAKQLISKIMNKTIWIILGVVVIIGLWFWSGYNRLITVSEAVDNQWAQVETQYQRRFDLIPNLVASVQGAMEQEREVFSNLAEARANYSGARGVDEQVAAANQVESALSRLLVVMEAYPDLRSTETVQTLMAQLEGTENRVSVERQRFNEQVREFNVLTKRFPTNILAGMFGFDNRNYFDAAEGSDVAPSVDLNISE